MDALLFGILAVLVGAPLLALLVGGLALLGLVVRILISDF